jgi:hypothetical protein
MNKITILGKNIINETQNCIEYKLTFKNIKKLLDDNLLLIPPFQTDIDEDKVDSMIESYKKNPNYLIFKNKIVIGYIIKTNNLYILDGNHRIEMIKKLYDEDEADEESNYLIFCCYNIENNKEMKNLFKEINKDSFKYNKYISLNELTENIYDLCKDILHKKYSLYFAERKIEMQHRLTITEFLNKLVENKYIEKFNNIDSLINDLENSNKKFNKLLEYQELFNDNNDNFYKDEYNCVKNGKIYALKNNNFIDYLNNNNIIPKHIFKYHKKIISPKLRLEVWNKEFGNNNSGKCPYNNCNNIINNSKNNFHCGHIISEYNGGETNLDNLKPICPNCNFKMGKKNWINK